ncbi:hypothetical protein LINPERHAP2_LOCUS35835 [Linum perenne]
MVGDHYVVSKEWRPNFEPGYSQVNTIRAWVRLPGLPLENFDVEILKLIGDRIGKIVRVDETTLFGSRGNYARMCVEIDLHKTLVSKYRLHRRDRRIEYDGMASMKSASSAEKERPELEEDFRPWMMAKKNVRRRNLSNPGKDDMTAKARDHKQNVEGSRFTVLDDSVKDANTERQLVFSSGETPKPHSDTKQGGPEEEVEEKNIATKEGGSSGKARPAVWIVPVKEHTRRTGELSKISKEATPSLLRHGIAGGAQESIGKVSKVKEARGANPKSKKLGNGPKLGKSKENKRDDHDSPGGGGTS